MLPGVGERLAGAVLGCVGGQANWEHGMLTDVDIVRGGAMLGCVVEESARRVVWFSDGEPQLENAGTHACSRGSD